jgi:ZIP family zinc transporter
MHNFNILFLAALAGLATLVGVFLGSFFKKTKNNIIFSASFSAGLMILIAIFELIPTAVQVIAWKAACVWVIAGAFVLWIVNRVIPHLHSMKEIKICREKCLIKTSYLIAIGMILHDFPEGFAIPSAFGHSDSLGVMLILATFFHNIPEGYILTMSKKQSGGNKFCIKAGMSSVVATFSGAVLAITLLAGFQKLNPVFLCLAAGAMLFISFHELLPESFRYKDLKIFLFGISMAAGVYFILSKF